MLISTRADEPDLPGSWIHRSADKRNRFRWVVGNFRIVDTADKTQFAFFGRVSTETSRQAVLSSTSESEFRQLIRGWVNR